LITRRDICWNCGKTETEAVDAALDAIAFRQEISEGIRRPRAADGLKDIYQD
jgi:hypothetical protein